MTKQSRSPDSGRALAPGNDTNRIAASLNSLGDDAVFAGQEAASAALPRSSQLAATVEAVIQARALRAAHLPPELFGDPAWDMLLELMHAELTHRRITFAILCKAAAVRPGTGRRWLDALARHGLCTGLDSDSDHCAIFLSEAGSRTIRAYFAALGQKPSAGRT